MVKDIIPNQFEILRSQQVILKVHSCSPNPSWLLLAAPVAAVNTIQFLLVSFHIQKVRFPDYGITLSTGAILELVGDYLEELEVFADQAFDLAESQFKQVDKIKKKRRSSEEQKSWEMMNVNLQEWKNVRAQVQHQWMVNALLEEEYLDSKGLDPVAARSLVRDELFIFQKKQAEFIRTQTEKAQEKVNQRALQASFDLQKPEE